MTESGFTMSLSLTEKRLITSLRNLPESRLRERIHRVVDDLVTFIEFPRCQWMQGDGVPCGTVDCDCDHCVHLTEMLDRVSGSLTTE